MRLPVLALAVLPLVPVLARAAESPGYHPYLSEDRSITTVDLAARTPRAQRSLPAPDPAKQVEPETIFAVEDIPGNAYPRKHTLYMNFVGADLNPGSDNSAEDKSTLARQGPYPAFNGDQATAIAAAQEVQNDVAAFGIRVVYEQRPPKILPYTMAMIGGSWTDTNLEEPAGGVAPIADCGALGQRHVVYVFGDGSWGPTGLANVTSQEAGHAWGLDHNLNCGSVMSYCGAGNGVFSSTCDGLCEDQCQGSAGCRLTHEMFCGEGNDQQNEALELAWIFGGNEPDLEPPIAEIVEPADGAVYEAGASIDVRAIVDDNYGGFGWRFAIDQDGKNVFDEVAYDRDIDEEYRAALNLVNIEAGDYAVTVEVMDHGDNVTTHTVMFHVEPGAETGNAEADGTSSDSGASADGETTGDPDDADTGAGTSSGGAPIDGDAPKEGCACAVDDRPARGLAALVLLALVRRRRVAGSA